MNLLLGYEMGLALLAHGQINECWTQAQSNAKQSQGPTSATRVEKGLFPQQLGRLRGQLSLEASGDKPVVVVLECGPYVLTMIADDDRLVYGVWSVTEARFYPLKADEMYGTHLTALITKLCPNVAVAAGYVWVAYFLTSSNEQEVAPVAAAAVTVAKKKTVVRKRPTVESAATVAVAEPVAKKSAAVLVEDDVVEINN
jgi:hypothetical protein